MPNLYHVGEYDHRRDRRDNQQTESIPEQDGPTADAVDEQPGEQGSQEERNDAQAVGGTDPHLRAAQFAYES